ncbi:MAG: YpdA family putative bacillithiol disulfide reductase [Rhodothermales bacterium]|nr:YpdA family putative bacillithiol disulfide reductase [Rhodothermales bacterium]
MIDVVVVGAGPVGLACAIEARQAGLDVVVVEKGSLVNSLVGYPSRMEFFSTPSLMEIGGHPFPTLGYKPTREEGIEYYRRVAEAEQLDIRLYSPVVRIDGERDAFRVTTESGTIDCRNVIVAVGFFDIPNKLAIPGEDLPHVIHYYKEPYPFSRQNVTIIGGKNSAAKAALDCYRHGANVTMVIRGPEITDSVKYWIKPDLINRIAEGSIAAFFNATISAIGESSVAISTPEGHHQIDTDWVLAMTGYRPDYALLETFGIDTGDDEHRTPIHDANSFETNRPGVYLAGTVCGGLKTSKWFIENGRFHAAQIVEHIVSGATKAHDLEGRHWRTAE